MLNSQRYDVKVVPEPRGPGFWDPGTQDELPQSLKVGPGTTLKFKRGTPGPPSKLKVRPQDLLQSLNLGPPHLSLINSVFSKKWDPLTFL